MLVAPAVLACLPKTLLHPPGRATYLQKKSISPNSNLLYYCSQHFSWEGGGLPALLAVCQRGRLAPCLCRDTCLPAGGLATEKQPYVPADMTVQTVVYITGTLTVTFL